jgi:hypothetical protein
LFAKGNPNYDEAAAVRWQATQVSYISITNFSGRILIGLISIYPISTHDAESYVTGIQG